MFELLKFAYNVKKNRLRMGFTQKQLAEKLYVSPQNVSKWEKGVCAPDIENLCNLADVLGITIDSLVGTAAEKKNSKVYLAVDGGGTKTEFLLFDENGEILGRTKLGAGNPNTVGIDETCRVLRSGIDEMLVLSGEISGIHAGMAGCANAEYRKAVLKFLRKTYPNIPCENSSDIVNVFGSNSECRDRCLAVICGTGSVGYAKVGEKLYQTGGWGYLFDGAGSGYDLGHDAICTAFAERDGFGERSLITPMVEEKLGGQIKENVNVLYVNGKDYIASFASIVFEAARKGDKTALGIIDKTTDRLAALINFAAEKYGCYGGVIFSGGLICERELLGANLETKLDKSLRLIYGETPQIIGSARVCLERFSKKEASEEFLSSLINNYNNMLNSEESENA